MKKLITPTFVGSIEYLATVGRDGKAKAIRLCSALSRMANGAIPLPTV